MTGVGGYNEGYLTADFRRLTQTVNHKEPREIISTMTIRMASDA